MYLSIAEFAKKVKSTPTTITKRIKKGEITLIAVRVEGKMKFRIDTSINNPKDYKRGKNGRPEVEEK